MSDEVKNERKLLLQILSDELIGSKIHLGNYFINAVKAVGFSKILIKMDKLYTIMLVHGNKAKPICTSIRPSSKIKKIDLHRGSPQ